MKGALGVAALLALAAAPAAARTLVCAPMWPEFCANVHVGCAGKTGVPTRGFTVRLDGGGAEVVFDGGEAWTARLAETETGRVLRPAEGRDWIRIDLKGQFSHAIRRGRKTAMSAGMCREAAG